MTIERGSLALLLVLRGELEANAIPVDIPDESLGIMDPFLRGGNVPEHELRVPDRSASGARERVAVWTERQRVEAEVDAFGAGTEADARAHAPEEPALARLRRRTRVVWWSAIVSAFAPLGVVLAFDDVRSTHRSALSRRERWIPAAAIVLATARTLALVLWTALALQTGP